MTTDPFYKKDVELRHGGHILSFRVSQDLFSSHQVDVGTRRLLRTLEDPTTAGRKILDLGCGYGPLGVTLQRLDPGRVVHMVDRDALAIAYCRQNAELNRLSGCEIYASLGYDDVSAADFDLIVCNLPAKAGEPVLAHLLWDARHHLQPRGRVAIVVVEPLATTVGEILDDPDVEIQVKTPKHLSKKAKKLLEDLDEEL